MIANVVDVKAAIPPIFSQHLAFPGISEPVSLDEYESFSISPLVLNVLTFFYGTIDVFQ
jgi:hypothetical protein